MIISLKVCVKAQFCKFYLLVRVHDYYFTGRVAIEELFTFYERGARSSNSALVLMSASICNFRKCLYGMSQGGGGGGGGRACWSIVYQCVNKKKQKKKNPTRKGTFFELDSPQRCGKCYICRKRVCFYKSFKRLQK